MFELICLLLPVAAFSGWYVGRRATHAKGTEPASYNELSSDYYAGLNFLLNEQTDKAVDAFIRMLESSPDSVETTKALGNFFRRRGEVERAIRIHQNLLAKPSLTILQRSQALLELAQDYLSAGVYDRAESLLLEVIQFNSDELIDSLRHLIDIYEREKDWDKAIQIAKRLQAVDKQYMGQRIAHYNCELAEVAWSKGKIRLAFKYLRIGLKHHRNCARISLLQGNFEKKLGKYRQAIKAYQRVECQDPAYLPEVLPMILQCYHRIGANKELNQYLSYLMKHCPSISIVLANATQVEETQGKEQAAHLLANYMYQHPSIRGLKHLIEFHLAKVFGEVRNELLMLKSFIEQLLEKRPVYRCSECGFASRLLHWQCPSCRQWAVVKPIQGLEGE